ncbi:MAG: hypothetical protein ISR58_16230 [Anaerolineales bacterium]|nr:hypothetical protein [Chloroflexota bacterium]MBL6982723.1 hypothetical protein [Anaerolineales bacterium]
MSEKPIAETHLAGFFKQFQLLERSCWRRDPIRFGIPVTIFQGNCALLDDFGQSVISKFSTDRRSQQLAAGYGQRVFELTGACAGNLLDDWSQQGLISRTHPDGEPRASAIDHQADAPAGMLVQCLQMAGELAEAKARHGPEPPAFVLDHVANRGGTGKAEGLDLGILMPWVVDMLGPGVGPFEVLCFYPGDQVVFTRPTDVTSIYGVVAADLAPGI